MLSILFQKRFRNRDKVVEFLTSLQELNQEVELDLNSIKSETLDFISSFYDNVDHYKEKEAAGNIVLIPFLGQVVAILNKLRGKNTFWTPSSS